MDKFQQENIDLLKEAENQTSYLRSVLDNVIDGIISINQDRIIETFNPAAEKIFGYSASEVIGQNVKVLMPEPYQSHHDNYVLNYLKTNKAKIIGIGREVRGQRKDGTQFPMDLAVSETCVRGRRRFIGIVRDITGKKNSEEALRKMNEQLEQIVEERTAKLRKTNKILEKSLLDLKTTQDRLVQTEKMAALGGLVSGVAHEINTPVGICVTTASYLEMKSNELVRILPEEYLGHEQLQKYLKTTTESLTSISSNLKRASELINSFKQVAVDQTTEEKRRFNLKEYIDTVLVSLHPKLKKTEHTLEVFCPDEIEIFSFPGVFSQIITNLVMNSLIHGLEDVRQGKITMDLSVAGDQCIFRYSDNGVGMPAEHVAKIYDPFFTTKRSRGGTGLGMHIVYNLVTQKLNGEIRCESILGQGTVFTIVFPSGNG
jgi:PAS domain S-box-containing protein